MSRVKSDLGFNTVEVDGRVYEIYQINTSSQLRVLSSFVKLFGTAISDFAIDYLGKGKAEKQDIDPLDAKEVSIGSLNLDQEKLKTAINKVFTRLDDDEVIKIISNLMAGVRKQSSSKAIDWEMEFKGRLMSLFKVVSEAFSWNFSDFLDEGFGALKSG
jgi:hypothetical protein